MLGPAGVPVDGRLGHEISLARAALLAGAHRLCTADRTSLRAVSIAGRSMLQCRCAVELTNSLPGGGTIAEMIEEQVVGDSPQCRLFASLPVVVFVLVCSKGVGRNV